LHSSRSEGRSDGKEEREERGEGREERAERREETYLLGAMNAPNLYYQQLSLS
jgi:hypothetical protein